MIDQKSRKRSHPENAFSFTAFGITVKVKTDSLVHAQKIKERISELFRNNISESRGRKSDFEFEIKKKGNSHIDLYKNGEFVVSGEANTGFLDYVETQIRLSVAEFAEARVFVHAGAVSWKGRGIVIPGNSYSGKTSLVREFVAAGAEYLSDEYAVFDIEGSVHPFAKPLSIRDKDGGFLQVDHVVEDLGGVCALAPVKVAYILHTSYEPGTIWKPTVLTGGAGVLKLLEHTLPIRVATKFSLEVFNKVASEAVFLESPRGESAETVKAFLEYIK